MQTRFLGFQIPYKEGMRLMRHAIEHIEERGNQLLLLEHTDCITVTRQHGTQSLLIPVATIQQHGIDVIETDRGGDATFHGQGQLVAYPILKLPSSIGVCDYVRRLELALIKACQDFGIQHAERKTGKTGVWIKDNKLIAIGVGISRQVTRHGFALNLTTDLKRFTDMMVPCGLHGFGVTSLERELGQAPSFEEAGDLISHHLQKELLL